MGITMIITGRSGKPERPSFFPIRAHLLTTGQRPAVVSLPSVGPCALRGGLRSLRSAPDNAAETAVPVIIVCAEKSMHRSLRLRKPATGSFIAIMDDASPAPSIFF